MSMAQEQNTLTSRWMRGLGYGGLVPFLGLAGLTTFASGSELAGQIAQINLIYGICIVSFLGAVHWGLAIAAPRFGQPAYLAGASVAEFETRCFVWGVTPALLAWLVGAFAPADLALWLLAAVLVVVWWADRALLAPLKAFSDYLRLRNHLTLGALVGLLLTAVFR